MGLLRRTLDADIARKDRKLLGRFTPAHDIEVVGAHGARVIPLILGVVACFWLIGLAARGLDDTPQPTNEGSWDVVLFGLLLLGIVASARRTTDDEDF